MFHYCPITIIAPSLSGSRDDDYGGDQGVSRPGVRMLTTRHSVVFVYTPQELQALFRDAREQDVEHGGTPRAARGVGDDRHLLRALGPAGALRD